MHLIFHIISFKKRKENFTKFYRFQQISATSKIPQPQLQHKHRNMAYKGMDIFANDVVYAREIERRKLLHREWVVATKPTSQTNGVVTLDQRTPESLSPRYSHLRRNPNKIEKQSIYNLNI